MQNASVVDLKRALDAFRKVDRFHRSASFKCIPGAKLKQLALAVEPKASVHRTAAGKYECRIDGKPMVNDAGTHATPHQAWACISRHLTAGVVLADPIPDTQADAVIVAVAAAIGNPIEFRQSECAQ